MTAALLERLVRNFPENGPKLLLENAANVRDLLVLLHEPTVDAIDFSAMTVERTTFIQPDYRHKVVDLLLKAPCRVKATSVLRKIFIYLLVEHQSMPQRSFMLRLAHYVLEVYQMQKRAWEKRHDSDAGLKMYPVLPVVLYTGDRPWGKIEPLSGLVEAGEIFQPMIPTFTPHFLNLHDTSPETLTKEGGFFGQILRLMQHRLAPLPVFRKSLEEVLAHLEQMTGAEGKRWSEFLSYIFAFINNARGDQEKQVLLESMDRTVQKADHRKEYVKMGRTIAEALIDEGRIKGRTEGQIEGKQQSLLLLLQKRFKKVPLKVQKRVAATSDIDDLEKWLGNIFDAKSLDEVGIPLD